MATQTNKSTARLISLSPALLKILQARAKRWAVAVGHQDERGSLTPFLKWAGLTVEIPQKEVLAKSILPTGAPEPPPQPNATLSQ